VHRRLDSLEEFGLSRTSIRDALRERVQVGICRGSALLMNLRVVLAP